VNHLDEIKRQAVLSLLVLLIGVGFGAPSVTGQASSGSSANLPSAQNPAARPQSQAKSSLPKCPSAGFLPAQASGQYSTHKVILSWNASPHSPRVQDVAVGYCLYRSKEKHVVQKMPTCKQCQQINTVPVVGTSCVDDLVSNKETYYYAVTAVNAEGNASAPSNEARAHISNNKQAGSSAGTSPPPPACRASSAGTK
jgi:hypothetical protein